MTNIPKHDYPNKGADIEREEAGHAHNEEQARRVNDTSDSFQHQQKPQVNDADREQAQQSQQ